MRLPCAVLARLAPLALGALFAGCASGGGVSPDTATDLPTGDAATPDVGAPVADALPASDRGEPPDGRGAPPDAGAISPPDAAVMPGADASPGSDATRPPEPDAAPLLDGGPPPPDAAPPPPACAPPFEPPVRVAAPDDGVALESLLEGAGYGSSGASSDWTGLTAGDFCPAPGPELVVVKNNHSFFSVLGGPTPHAIGAGDLDSDAASPWRAVTSADLDGDGRAELVAVRHVGAVGVNDFEVASADAGCHLASRGGLSVGTPANSDWVGLAAADFDGDGVVDIAAAKNAHSNFVFLHAAGGGLSRWTASDLDSVAGHPWRGLAAGDLDGDGHPELVAVRSSADAVSTILVYGWNAGTGHFERRMESDFGHGGNSDWTGVTVGDFNGDGRASIVLQKDRHSAFAVLAADGRGGLSAVTSGDLATAPGQGWRGLSAVDWLGGDAGAHELVALRAATAPYETDVLIYGAAFQRAARERAVADTRAQYASEPLLAGTTQLDVDLLKDWLTETHANTYSYLLWDTTGDDYLNLVRFLEATRDFCVDGRALRVWVTLIPPSEVSGARCSVAADSPSTPFAEATFFARGLAAPESCTDYGAWGNLLGALAARYPQLVAVNIDDFTANYPADIRPETVAALTSNLRAAAPWVAFVPTFYYHAAGGGFVGDSLPDLGAATDGGLFYFRNEAQGQGPCAACDTPRPCANACLADTCAEATVPNLAVEATRVAAGLFGHPLLIGLYVTGHSACGTPSVEYERAALEAALTLPIARGVTVYTTQHPAVDCAANGRADRGCVVQSAFARHP